MDLFCIKRETVVKLDKVLKDYGFTHDRIKRKFFRLDSEISHIDVINSSLMYCDSTQSLFSNDNRFVQNVVMAKLFQSRLESMEEMEHSEYMNTYGSHDIENVRELTEIVTGFNVIHLFDTKFITIDWNKYGFTDAEELYYTMGAHIANIISYQDSRIILVKNTDEVKYKNQLYVYGNDVHGDFRFFQYDISSHKMENPFEPSETLPFSRPVKIGGLTAYHSVEHLFLLGLLSLVKGLNLKLSVLDNFEEFVTDLTKEKQVFGDYSDAGLYSHSSVMSSFSCLDLGIIPSIPLEYAGRYNGKIEGDKLVYAHDSNDEKVCATIESDMLDELIKGMFYKVHAGNGRSSTAEMTDCILYFKEKYYDKS